MTIQQWLVVTVPMVIIVIGLFVLIFLPAKPAQVRPIGSDEPRPDLAAAPARPAGGSATSSKPSYATIDNLIAVDAPFKNATVTSPLVISGTARGTWYFEASAPVELRDASGTILVQSHVDAHPPAGGDWMTEDFVPFKATLIFPKQPAGSTGTLVLHNDNPSGDPTREKKLEIPVNF